jgi:hypothetical protein
VHAFVQVGVPETNFQRAAFFDNIGCVLALHT